MKTTYKVALTLLAGAAIGAAAVEVLHAQAKPPVYMVYENELTNRDGYVKEYIPGAIATIKAHGGRIVAAGKPTTYAGEPPKEPASFGILVFDSTEQLEGWLHSDDYKKIRAIGEQYAKYRNIAVQGFPQ
jgi:uncharacterized protein (DUF1330 family)